MEVFLNRVAKLGGAVAAGAIVGNNFLFNGKHYLTGNRYNHGDDG